MKIVQVIPSPYAFKGGCWFYRQQMPSEMLRARGHDIKFVVAGLNTDIHKLDYPDIVVFKGTYSIDPIHIIRELKKTDTKIVYDVDDDYLTLNPGNPLQKESKAVREQYISLCKEANLITTTTSILKKRLQKYNKNVVIIPNALNPLRYNERAGEGEKLTIGYTGASSHWEDIGMVLDVIRDLQEKYDFTFILQGMCGTPLIGEMYTYGYIDKENLEPEKKKYYTSALKMYEKLKGIKYLHVPFYPPELYPEVLRSLNFDIGIAPLKDNTFNQAKSSVKFYEYVTTGTPCLASDVLPYRKEVNYRAKNTYKDWYNKLEKMIKDKKFRAKIYYQQSDFVDKHANLDDVVKVWESTFQKL